MLLNYGDEENPHRPDKSEYNIQFELDDEESDATENEDTDQIRDGRHLFNVATVVLECPIEEASKLEPRIKSEIAFMSKKVKRHAEEFLKELADILPSMKKNPPPPPLRTTNFRGRPMSTWDFVPIVGSIKSIVEGAEDLKDGYHASAATHLALGVGGLALDLVSVGMAVTATRTVVKVAAQETIKGAVTTAAKGAGTLAVTKVTEAAAVYVATRAIKRTIHEKRRK
ncbi:unnamed protein product [Rotaria socialis]